MSRHAIASNPRPGMSRRRLLASAVASPVAGCAAPSLRDPGLRAPAGPADIHVHLFGAGDAGSGCRLSKTITDGVLYKILVRILGLETRAGTIDESYVDALVELLRGSGLHKAAILGQDAVYHRRGAARGRPDWKRTHFYVPNDYVFEITQAHRDVMIPCVSINPDRRDALDELEYCHHRGARILKIHPPTQGVDLADKKHTRFFRRCAALGMLVMVHTGHEHAAPIIDVNLADPRKLTLSLDQGCTVIASHCGTGRPGDKPDQLPHFLALLAKYDRLYGDTSALGFAQRVDDADRLFNCHKDIAERLVHGSDFPFPSTPIAFGRILGRKTAARLQGDSNMLRRDLALKEALGVGRAAALRTYRLLERAGAFR